MAIGTATSGLRGSHAPCLSTSRGGPPCPPSGDRSQKPRPFTTKVTKTAKSRGRREDPSSRIGWQRQTAFVDRASHDAPDKGQARGNEMAHRSVRQVDADPPKWKDHVSRRDAEALRGRERRGHHGIAAKAARNPVKEGRPIRLSYAFLFVVALPPNPRHFQRWAISMRGLESGDTIHIFQWSFAESLRNRSKSQVRGHLTYFCLNCVWCPQIPRLRPQITSRIESEDTAGENERGCTMVVQPRCGGSCQVKVTVPGVAGSSQPGRCRACPAEWRRGRGPCCPRLHCRFQRQSRC